MSNKVLIERAQTEITELFAQYGSGDYQPTEEESDIINTGLELELRKLAVDLGRQRAALGTIAARFDDRPSMPFSGPPAELRLSVEVDSGVHCTGHVDYDKSEKAKNARDFQPFDVPESCAEVSREDYMALSDAFMRVVEELKITDKLLDARDKLVAMVPACGPHGPGCLAHAEEWIKRQRSRHIPDFELKDEDLTFNSYKNGFAVVHKPSNFEVRIGGLRSSHANRAACIASLQAHLKAHWSNIQ